jgi:hypothetical protein
MAKESLKLTDSQIDDLIDIVLDGSTPEYLGGDGVVLYARGRTIQEIREYLEELNGSNPEVSQAPTVHSEVSATG